MTSIRRFGWTALALFALVGCEPASPPATTAPASTPSPSGEPTKAPSETKALPVVPTKPEEPKGADAGKPTEEQLAEIKKLPASEQPIAIAQAKCPVSGDPLGEMGAPIKQVVGDKTFYLCCAGCEKKVKSDPAGVLADLAKMKK